MKLRRNNILKIIFIILLIIIFNSLHENESDTHSKEIVKKKLPKYFSTPNVKNVYLYGSILHIFSKSIFGKPSDLLLFRSVIVATYKLEIGSKGNCELFENGNKTGNTFAIYRLLRDRATLHRKLFIVECYLEGGLEVLEKTYSIRLTSNLNKYFIINIPKPFIELITHSYREQLFSHNTCLCSPPNLVRTVSESVDLITHISYLVHYNVSLIVLYFYEDQISQLNLVKEYVRKKFDKYQNLKIVFELFDLGPIKRHIDTDKLTVFNECFTKYKYKCRSFVSHDQDELIIPHKPNIDYYSYLEELAPLYSNQRGRSRCSTFQAHIVLNEHDVKNIMKQLTYLVSINFRKMFLKIDLSHIIQLNYFVFRQNQNVPVNMEFCKDYIINLIKNMTEFFERKKSSKFLGNRYYRALTFASPHFHGQQKYGCLTPFVFGLGTHGHIDTPRQSGKEEPFDSFVNVISLFSETVQNIFKRPTHIRPVPIGIGKMLHHRTSLKPPYKATFERPLYSCNSFYFTDIWEMADDLWKNSS
ncbi:hypothetical protein SNEBB_002682 [Seison nebaliae]|nr:hypothetical protein SNEBB_002682 [Seison nebaliae]